MTKWHTCWVGVGVLLLAAAQRGPTPVAVSTVVERDVGAGQSFVGTILPSRTSVVGSAVDGRVVEFPVNEGDRVQRGQPLARLLTATLEIELSAARAELELRNQELAELKAGSRPEEVEQAQARMLAFKAQRDYWVARADRTRGMFERNAASAEDMQLVASELERVRQSLTEAEAAHKLAVLGPRKERIAQAEARVQQQMEEVRRIEDQISKHTIVAPFDGYVSAEHTEIGAWLMRGAAVAEIVELDQVDVQVMVPEDLVTNLDVAQSARVDVAAVRDRAIEGRIVQIVPKADLRSRSFPVKIRVDNAERGGSVLLKAGMFARATLAVGKREKALLVAKDAIVLGGPSPLVFVAEADPANAKQAIVRPILVEMGISEGGLIQVIGPIEAGQQIVVQGNERLRPGQTVLIARVLSADAAAPVIRGTGESAESGSK